MTKENLTKTLGETIRLERKKRKITLNDLASKLDISTTYLGLIEMGKRGKNINIELLCKIAYAFDVSVDYLLGQAERPTPAEGEEYVTLLTLYRLMTEKEREQLVSIAQVLVK